MDTFRTSHFVLHREVVPSSEVKCTIQYDRKGTSKYCIFQSNLERCIAISNVRQHMTELCVFQPATVALFPFVNYYTRMGNGYNSVLFHLLHSPQLYHSLYSCRVWCHMPYTTTKMRQLYWDNIIFPSWPHFNKEVQSMHSMISGSRHLWK